MSDIEPDAHLRPYSFDVEQAPGSTSLFQWMIRKHGKAFQRSDRTYPSEAEARRRALDMIERLITSPF